MYSVNDLLSEQARIAPAVCDAVLDSAEVGQWQTVVPV